MDFVFRTASGVNRPLRFNEDHPGDNLNRTFYLDQINKVANAIKEIITGLKTKQTVLAEEKREPKIPYAEEIKEIKKAEPSERGKRAMYKLVSVIVAALLLIAAAIIIYPAIFKQNRLDKLRSSGERISVAVMPFQNMTGDITWDIWQDGIQDILINSLSNSEELKVRQAESVNSLIQTMGSANNYASLTPSVARHISRKLETDIFVSGNMKKAGPVLRVYAQLIDSKTKEVYKSFQIERFSDEEMIFNVVDSLSAMVKNYLIISELHKGLDSYYRHQVSTSSPEAFRYFIYGRNEFYKKDHHAACNWLSKAVSTDSNFFHAINMLALAYGNDNVWDQAKKWSLKAYTRRDQMPVQQKINTDRIYASYFETPQEEIRYLKQLLEFDDQDHVVYYNLGNAYNKLYQFDKAIPEYEKAFKIYKKRGIKPDWVDNYTGLGRAYHHNGQYKEEQKLYREAVKHFPDDIFLIRSMWILANTLGDTVEAGRLYAKAESYFKSISTPEANMVSIFALACVDAGLMDEAEESFRRALSLEPQNPVRMNALAYFLIENDRNIPEGLELVEKALQIDPDHYNNFHTKGLCLYKQGKYREALDLLQKSWDLRRELAVYNHEAFMHLEAAKKAAAGEK